MHSITFTCKTLTPMFLSGADPSRPELRSPSIKGAMRWWWRSMNGHIELNQLNKIEGKLFGDNENRSKVIIQASHPERTQTERDWFSFANLSKGDVRKYLFYSLGLKGNRERKGFPPGQEFNITISANEKPAFHQGIATFWLLAFLGGIGNRARRGGGNFYIKEVTMPNLLEELNLSFQGMKGQDILDFYKTNIVKVRNIIQQPAESRMSKNIYSNIDNATLVFSSSGKDLNDIGLAYKQFREGFTGNKNLLDKAAFGLPLTSTMPPKRSKYDHTEVVIENQDYDRRSSPIILRTILFQEKIYWLVLYLQGKLLNDKVSLVYSHTGKKANSAIQLSDRLLNGFIEHLKQNGNPTLTL